MPKKSFEYTDFLEDWHDLEKKVGRDFRDYAGKWKNGYNPEVEYQDFWHFFIECYNDKISNDTYMFDINWGYVKELAKTDWQREIAQYFIDEYGTEDRNYWLCW